MQFCNYKPMLPNYKSMLQVHKGKNHTSMADIVSGFEKILLEAALSAAREEAEAQEAAEEAFAEPDESAQKRRKVALSKSLAQSLTKAPCQPLACKCPIMGIEQLASMTKGVFS